MEFTKTHIIESNNKFIIFGQINDTSVVIFSKFEIDKIKLNLSKTQFDNEDYWTFDINNKKINVICQKDHIKDNPKDKYITITENKDDYNNIILPYINNIYKTNTKWILDILNKKTEVIKPLLNDANFMIIKDKNYVDNNKKNFYVLAIPRQDIKTIRDLRAKHIDILLQMRDSCIKFASKKCINENELYFFFHYHPSFYHLHLHCCIINHKSLTSKFFRCKMLDTVLINLKYKSNFYRDSNIKFEIPEKHIIAKLLYKEN